MEIKYQITLTEEQMRYISVAVEMYSRMLCGQVQSTSFVTVLEEAIWALHDHKKGLIKRDYVDTLLMGIKGVIWGDDLYPQANHSVGTNKMADIGFDIYKSINHHLKMEYDAEAIKNGEKVHWNVDSSSPSKYSDQPLPTIKTITNE